MNMKIMALFLGLFLLSCTSNVRRHEVVANDGKVDINGKKCDVIIVNPGDVHPNLYYIDCPNGSGVSYKSGKSPVTSVTTPKENQCKCNE